MSSKNQIVVREHIVRKDFSYKKGDISLRFTLRIDIKSELKDFDELLAQAREDIIEEIKKFDK